VRAREHRRFALTSVQSLTFLSAPLQPTTLRQLAELFPQAVIRNYYSSTEASPAGVGTIFDPERPTSVGRPEDWCAVRVVDDTGRELAAGQTGEVLLRADGVAGRRYADDAEASAAVFQDGWVRTGDLGHLDADGFLYLDDRKADVVNTGGFKVAAQEVERVLCEHPAVSEAAVFGRTHPVLGEAVAAAVIVTEAVESADLIRFCVDRLADFKVPSEVSVVDDFPRGALGKPLKRVLAGR
jgi:acyl-CoA synthetase (AMP-forming)/AMP-acid ligase II